MPGKLGEDKVLLGWTTHRLGVVVGVNQAPAALVEDLPVLPGYGLELSEIEQQVACHLLTSCCFRHCHLKLRSNPALVLVREPRVSSTEPTDLGESDWSSNIEIRDARTMELQKVIPFNGEGRFLTFSPDASLLLLHVIHHQGELRDYFRSFEVYSIAR